MIIITTRWCAITVYAVVVCLSDASIVSQWLNLGSCKQRQTIAQRFVFFDAKNFGKIPMGSPPTGVPNARGVG